MPHLTKALFLCLPLALAACSGAGTTRYLVESGTAEAPARLRVNTIEVRDVMLPAYGEETQILRETAEGGLRPLRGAQWADGSARAITAELARGLDLRSSASVAAEPWPLTDPADIRLEVRIERLVARADGQFQLSGQYAVASPDGRIRDFLERFEIVQPVDGEGAAPVAEAYGAALAELSRQITRRLAR